jgi:hypothetical protein
MRGSGGIVPLILNPVNRQISVVDLSLYTRKKPPVPMKYKVVSSVAGLDMSEDRRLPSLRFVQPAA